MFWLTVTNGSVAAVFYCTVCGGEDRTNKQSLGENAACELIHSWQGHQLEVEKNSCAVCLHVDLVIVCRKPAGILSAV